VSRWLWAVLLMLCIAGTARAEAVDLNVATAEQLQRLPGIGPKKAEAILALRQKRPFTRVTQLLEVRGIGKRTLDRLKPHVTVGPVPPASGPR
jgi:competence protein ComEA